VVAIAEGGFAAMLATEVLESTTLRMRPYVHAIADPEERDRVIAKTGIPKLVGVVVRHGFCAQGWLCCRRPTAP